MNSLSLSYDRRARIWLGEFPAAEGGESEPLLKATRIHVDRDRATPARTRAAIELFVPLGGRFLYGLLGVELVGTNTATLEIMAPVCSAAGSLYEGSLAGSLDEVRWGLPEEYATAVLDGARLGIQAHGCPEAGALRFSVAAHGAVGSAGSIFGRLAKAVIALLLAGDSDVSDLGCTLTRILE